MDRGIELLKTDEVARELGKKREFVTSEIRKGKIKAVKSGGEYLISRRDLNTYLGIESEDELLRMYFATLKCNKVQRKIVTP